MSIRQRVPHVRFPAALVAVFALGIAALAADVTPSATVDRHAIRLSESVRVELAAEGPAPLRVEFPNGVLSDSAADIWRLRPERPVITADLPDGRQRWAQAFRADPYRPGDPLRIEFAPALVIAGGDAAPRAVEFPPVEIRVTTGIDRAADPGIRPITGIEDVRSDGPTEEPSAKPWLAIGILVVGAALVLAYVTRFRRETKPSPRGVLIRQLESAERARADNKPAVEVATIVADAIRQFLSQQYGVPAARMTTEEVLSSRDWPAEIAAELRGILTTIDRLRFERDSPDTAPDLTRRATELAERLTDGY